MIARNQTRRSDQLRTSPETTHLFLLVRRELMEGLTEYLPSVSAAPDSNPTPWCFHQPENQWLVPVMSPSKGLIYKPYSGPSAPTSGFLAPIYASCTPLGVPPLAGNFMNTVYGVAAFHGSPSLGVRASAITTNYFPTYGPPNMNPTISTSPVEQVSNLACSRPNGQID
ncbi:unnamed protein product [Musa banksii]